MVTRISGFSSGLDIDELVKKMMSTQKAPLNKLNQQKTVIEWQREQYRTLNSKLVDFRNNKLSTFGLSNSIGAKQATITGNSSAVTATASSSAVNGSMSINVTSLATAANAKSTAGIGNVSMTDSIESLIASGKLDSSILVGDKVTIDVAGATPIELNKSDTLGTLMSRLNNSKEANVNAYIDSYTGTLVLTSKTTGKTAGVDNVVPPLNVSGAIFGAGGFKLGATQDGANAVLSINGIATERSSNTFTENGVTITLNAASLGTASNIVVSTNTDKIMDTIKSFISEYNSLIEGLNNKLSEERYRKYTPLSTEQKDAMKDDEIKLWEEKAKSGLLRNDTTLSGIVSDMRLASVTSVDINGNKVNLSSFGITTGDWTQRGKLVIADDSKLRAAIEADPDAVIKFFTQQTTESDPKKKGSATNPDNGLFNRLSNIVMTGLERLATKAGTSKYSTDVTSTFLANSTMGEQLRTIDKKIDSATLRLNMIETRYYKQFTAMEKAMNRYNAQSSIFS
ncbi:MAG: flagellar filament capping protein FliD [Candidatus Cohnella colombiensis]|uniref:Flagellar hook-associated protein 2 n=1 Tax=Candidatus Cohnella colombiensis TaxID=3121368 RepID=A0AA95EW81_9BACL|nr:MAG: flagellar filament capping protein FliD [Cohnella sp.]